jgi:hypothetical protein
MSRYDVAERKLLRFLLFVGVDEATCSKMLLTGSLPRRGEAGPFFRPSWMVYFLSSERLIGLFIGFSSAAHYAYSTVVGDLFAFRSRAVAPGLAPPPSLSPHIARLLRGYKKVLPPGKNKRTPLSTQLLVSFVSTLAGAEAADLAENTVTLSPATIQLALLTTAFVACLRVGEYTGHALQWTDVRVSPACCELLRSLLRLPAEVRRAHTRTSLAAAQDRRFFINLVLRKTKASPHAPVRVTLWPFRLNQSACPLTSLLVYMASRVLADGGLCPTSPFFGDALGTPVCRTLWTRALRRLGEQAGLSEEQLGKLSPHSLRGGGATAASVGGAHEDIIKALGRWRSDAVRVYIDTADVRALRAQQAIERTMRGT